MVASPILIPVNEPGPFISPNLSIFFKFKLHFFKVSSIRGKSFSECVMGLSMIFENISSPF